MPHNETDRFQRLIEYIKGVLGDVGALAEHNISPWGAESLNT